MFGIADDYSTALAPGPDGEGLEAARRTLRELTGRPGPAVPQPLGGLADCHHGLLVGPCDADTIGRETACPLVEEVSGLDPDGFDCTYWSATVNLRGKLLPSWQSLTEKCPAF
jgi:hypothetical protein